jgi:hypothetical protein
MGEETTENWRNGQRSRGMTSAMAAVILIVTIVVIAAASFFVFNAIPATKCEPASAPACQAAVNTHDITLSAAFTAVQQGVQVPFTAILPGGESASSFVFHFGDGTTLASTSPTVDHTYTNPGTFLAWVTAKVGGVTHDNLHGIVQIVVSASYAKNTLGNIPGIFGNLTANSTASTGATGVIAPSGSISVSGRYTSAPANPAWTLLTPKIVTSGGSLGTPTTTTVNGFTEVSNKVTFPSAGSYLVTLVAGSQSGSTIEYQNYTWTAYVATGAAALTPPLAKSPHPGKLIVEELAPGGAYSEDPSVDYETVGYEVIVNVFQKLIDYNGSDSLDTPNGFIPVIASCVPGSALCTSQFPSELPGESALVTNLSVGAAYTFVISSTPQFYDYATGAHWGIYPSDVLFSMTREIAPGDNGESTPGWIQAQALLPYSNGAFDPTAPIPHSPYNTTPAQVYSHILVNASNYCPSTAMSNPAYHGCVTFIANGSGVTPGAKAWPFFLQLMAAIGSSIVPAGWYSAPSQGAGIPGWTYGTVSGSGDHPVLLPGGATSSDQASFKAAVAAMAPSIWDTWIVTTTSAGWGNVNYRAVGSGPYYLSNYVVGTSYQLKANPYYAPNPACSTTYVNGVNYCYPQKGAYVSEIDTTWEADPTAGEQALAAGVADFAAIPVTQTALILQLIQQHKAALTLFPSISIFFWPFDLLFNKSAATSGYSTGPITVPQDWFSYVGMRQFFYTAYPYSTAQSTISTKQGVPYFFNYGGVIPQYMGNYYPTNITWPSTDPTVNYASPYSPSYWFAQMKNPSSPYYDPELSTCTTSSPCQLPWFGETGAPDVDERAALLAQEVKTFSNGTIILNTLDINFVNLVINSLFSGPGGNPMPLYQLGWAPDYPDPTDYIGAMYYPNATYTYSDAEWAQLEANPTFNASGCPTAASYYLANPVVNKCQGAAYIAMTQLEYTAAPLTNLAQRALLYNMAEHIAEKLALYINWGQQNQPYIYAPWINGQSIDEQVTLGGGADTMWFWVNGNGVT